MQVAAAERQTQEDVPVLITGNWMLTIVDSSLSGKLNELTIQSQQPEPGSPNVNLLFGTVASAASETVYRIHGGQTDVVDNNNQKRQYVWFNLVIGEKLYLFLRGELVDQMSIKGGHVYSFSLTSGRVADVEDGTWSAQATPAEDEHHHHHHYHKHGGRSEHGRD